MKEVAFGRYRLLSVIGQGGMGTVYRAHDTVIDRDIAIKVLSAELAGEPGLVVATGAVTTLAGTAGMDGSTDGTGAAGNAAQAADSLEKLASQQRDTLGHYTV